MDPTEELRALLDPETDADEAAAIALGLAKWMDDGGFLPDLSKLDQANTTVKILQAMGPAGQRVCIGTLCLMRVRDDDVDTVVAEDDGQPDEAQEWHDFDPDC